MMKYKLTCESGTARVVLTTAKGTEVLQAGSSVEKEVDDEKKGGTLQGAFGIGSMPNQDAMVSITPLSGDMVVREYKDVNHFLDPEAEDYEDHVVEAGETLATPAIQSNAITLVPLRHNDEIVARR